MKNKNNTMETKKKINTLSNRHSKLSLKKNKLNTDVKDKNHNRSSDVIVLDESLDRCKLEDPGDRKQHCFFRSPEVSKNMMTNAMTFSPIILDDSCNLSDDELPKVILHENTPSKMDNVSFTSTRNTPSPVKDQPSFTGWSPAQNIITANPKQNSIPSTPKDSHNKSHEQCTMKTIEKSQKKILNELYGKSWKSIPKLFKTICHQIDNFDGVAKKLFDDDDDDDDNDNLIHLKLNKDSYLPSSNVKRIEENVGGTEKKSRKKLFIEKVPTTPDVTKQKIIRNVNSTTKKVKIKKGMSITEMVEVMKNSDKAENADILMNRIDNDLMRNTEKKLGNIGNGEITKNIDILKKKMNVENEKSKNVEVLMKRIENVAMTPKNDVKTLSFVGSLADNVPTWRCHPEAFQYRDNFKSLKEQLSRRLYKEFNSAVFGDGMDADMQILWDTKLRSTAGTTTNSSRKNARGDRIRASRIKLSTKVVDTPQRARDTLVHEMCHAATWLIDGEMRAGHGPLWKKWARRALQVFPELGEISRCHDMEIHFKYSYKCLKCGYTIQRHSKSIDITKKACGYCRGTFQIVVNKKNKDGVVVTTPAKKVISGFALYVKENYASVKDGSKTHAQVMKILGEQYSAKKSKPE